MSAEKKKVPVVRVTLHGGAVEEVPGRVAYAYGPLVIYVGETYQLRGWAQGSWVSFEVTER